MAKTLDQVLGYRSLTGIITSPNGGVPNVWPEACFTGATVRPIVGDTAEWTQVPNSRRTSRSNNYGSKSREQDMVDIIGRVGKCVHSFEHINHKMNVLTALRNMEDMEAQKRGQAIVDIQTAEFRRKFNNLRVAAVSSIFRHGAVYFDGDGNLLPSSSGAVTTVDMQVPANNKNQLNSAISASWATDGTDVLGDLATIQLRAVQATGLPLKYAYYGKSICEYLTSNTTVKELLKANASMSEAFTMNRIPKGFGIENLEWRPLYTSYYVDNDGTDREWFPGDFIVFMPEVTPDWYLMLEGSFEVPTSVNPTADANSANSDFKTVQGMFSYAHPTSDPPGIKHLAGDTFLPALRNPSAVFLADVVA